MSTKGGADVLRRASTQMHADWDSSPDVHARRFVLAVADWLDVVAARADRVADENSDCSREPAWATEEDVEIVRSHVLGWDAANVAARHYLKEGS